MPQTDQMNFVYTDSQKHEKGFTFISLILMISVISITIPYTAYLVKATDFTSNYDQLSVQQFFYFLRDEVIIAEEIDVHPSELSLMQYDGSTVLIEKRGSLISRQVDGQGYEIYLRNVQNISYRSLPYGFQATITTTNGDQFEKDIIFY